jgi:DNA-binding MarR family transcriptional regulator
MMEAMKLLREATDNPELQMHTANTFLYVAYRHPTPVPMVEIERTVGMGQTTNSRNIGYWARGAGKREKGWGMFKVEADPFYAKRKLVTLTQKGEALAARLSKALAL